MPKRGNDNLENFFRKVSDLPDIPFDEEDWNKLEARLEAKETHLRKVRSKRSRLTGAVVIAGLLMSSYIWMGEQANQLPDKEGTSNVVAPQRASVELTVANPDKLTTELATGKREELKLQNEVPSAIAKGEAVSTITKQNQSIRPSPRIDVGITTRAIDKNNSSNKKGAVRDFEREDESSAVNHVDNGAPLIDLVDSSSVIQEETPALPVMTEENKQRANIQLPEAEDKEVTVSKVLGIEKAKLSTSPRLSLLLSLAPDFSTTSFGEYSDPGETFGIMIHYHVKNSWSFSTGILKSNKKYTGDGDEYHPPKGYWKYYTNGIVPTSVDGSCGVLEIPVMIQYTVAVIGRSKFIVGAGASSYIMLNESYNYNFEEPNPGARDGWSSGKNSAFLFNMINVTIGYEFRVLPRVMLGVEPYVKIPVEEIGWSDLKLFSTGASLTFRYNVLNKKNPVLSTRSRGPD